MTSKAALARELIQELYENWTIGGFPADELALEMLACGLSAVYAEHGRDGLEKRLQSILAGLDSLPKLAPVPCAGGWTDSPAGQEAKAAFAAHAAGASESF